MSLVFRGTRRELHARLAQVARALSGRAPDSYRIVRPVLTRGAVALLAKIQAAFVIKARGGTDEAGIKWAPLKRATVAARRATRDELRALGVGGRRVRGLLTPAQDAEWRRTFARTLGQMRGRGMEEAEAMGVAARVAWAKVKAMGAKTRLELLGGRAVEILRDTGRLLRSLEPGTEDAPRNPANQVLRVRAGEIVVGTKVEYALSHHRGNPAKNLPARPLWPDPANIPDAWWAAVNAAILRGMLRAIAGAVG